MDAPSARAVVLHGIVDDWSPTLHGHRNYLPRRTFRNYLVELQTLDGHGHIQPSATLVTIDDATRAGADACLEARSLGYDVIFFINPYQIETGEPYFFSLMDAYIDARVEPFAILDDEKYDLEHIGGRRRYRHALKRKLAQLLPADSLSEMHRYGKQISKRDLVVPAHAAPLSLSDIRELYHAGVSIESHGWSHRSIGAIESAAFEEHIFRAKDWLRCHLSHVIKYYAVPFGEPDIPANWRHMVSETCFLVDSTRVSGSVRSGCINREDLARIVPIVI